MEFESEEARTIYYRQQLDHHFGHLEPGELTDLMDLVGQTYSSTIERVYTDPDAVALEVVVLMNGYGSDESMWTQRINEWRRRKDNE